MYKEEELTILAGLSRNSSHLCVNPAEGNKWLTCLSVISTLLDNTRGWLELPQIQASCYVGAGTGCVCRWNPASLDIRLGSTLCRFLHGSQPQPSTPGHSMPLSPLWRNRLDLRAPPPLMSTEQYFATTTSTHLPNSTSQIQRSKAWAALPRF